MILLSIYMHHLLWMNVMLDFIWMGFAELPQRETSEKFKMKIYVSAGNQISDPSLSKRAP